MTNLLNDDIRGQVRQAFEQLQEPVQILAAKSSVNIATIP